MLELLNKFSVNYWNEGTETENIISHIQKQLNLGYRDVIRVSITRNFIFAEIEIKFFKKEPIFLNLVQEEFPNFKTEFKLK